MLLFNVAHTLINFTSTTKYTDVNKLSEPFKWEDEVCSASRFYELDNLLRQCERTIRVNLGVEVFLEQFHLCKTSLSSPGATVQDKQQACKHVRLAGRPYKKINGVKGGAGASHDHTHTFHMSYHIHP